MSVHQAYDAQANALYLRLRDGAVARTKAFSQSTNVDEDAGGRLLGIEVLSPGSLWPLHSIIILYEDSISEGDAVALMAGYPFPPPVVEITS